MKHIRSVLGGAIVGGAAAFSVVACSTVQVAPVAQTAQPTPVVAAAPIVRPVVAPTTATAPATNVAKHRATVSTPKTTTTTTKAPKHRSTTTTSSSAGCGQRAVTAGVFNSSCSEYQGYLDPGVAGGRAPSSGDIQNAWADCIATRSVAECRKELN